MPVEWVAAIIIVVAGVIAIFSTASYWQGYYKGRFDEICSQRTVDIAVENIKSSIERVK